jgi:hypothetical protein
VGHPVRQMPELWNVVALGNTVLNLSIRTVFRGLRRLYGGLTDWPTEDCGKRINQGLERFWQKNYYRCNHNFLLASNDACSGKVSTTWSGRYAMAFIRKRGQSYYLVHNVRQDGRVRQIHLAKLGRRPRISDDLIRGVTSQHPFVEIDWKGLREKASQELVRPFENDSRQLRELLASIRNLHLDIGDLHLPVLAMTHDRELVGQLTSSLKLLRTTLDVKLNQLRRGRVQPYSR